LQSRMSRFWAVEQLIRQSDLARKEQFSVRERQQRTISYIHRICKKENISVEALKSGNRHQNVFAIRSQEEITGVCCGQVKTDILF